MYILKTQGTSKIPDYIQLRDEHYALVAHIRAYNPKKQLEKLGYGQHVAKIVEAIEKAEYGVVFKVEV